MALWAARRKDRFSKFAQRPLHVLPLLIRPCELDLSDDGEPTMSIRASGGGWSARVPKVGHIRRASIFRRYEVTSLNGEHRLEVRGRFFSRRSFDLVRGNERVGGLEISRPDSPLLGLLTGGSQSLRLDVPSDADAMERKLLVAASVLIERGHL